METGIAECTMWCLAEINHWNFEVWVYNSTWLVTLAQEHGIALDYGSGKADDWFLQVRTKQIGYSFNIIEQLRGKIKTKNTSYNLG